MNSTDVALHEGQHRDMQIQSPSATTPPEADSVAWAEGLAAAHRIGSARSAAPRSSHSTSAALRRQPPRSLRRRDRLHPDAGPAEPLRDRRQARPLRPSDGRPPQASGHAVWTVEKSDESVTVAGIRRGTQNEVRET